MGSIIGSILSAIVLTILPEALRNFQSYRMVIYSLALILIMIFRPSGLFGMRELSISGVYSKLSKFSKKGRVAVDGTAESK